MSGRRKATGKGRDEAGVVECVCRHLCGIIAELTRINAEATRHAINAALTPPERQETRIINENRDRAPVPSVRYVPPSAPPHEPAASFRYPLDGDGGSGPE